MMHGKSNIKKSLNIIEWLVSVTETECVSCAVRAAFLSMKSQALIKDSSPLL
jgi:hydroxyethylthiazole kinase-like sugar kinase family protein